MTKEVKALIREEELALELADELDVVFDLSDLVRLHKGICYAAFQDAIVSYDLDLEHAAATFLPMLLRDELVQQYLEEEEEFKKKVDLKG